MDQCGSLIPNFGMKASEIGTAPRTSSARNSTEDQKQEALNRASCERIFEEKGSGRAGTGSPALKAALAFLRPEDQLIV